MSPNEQGRFCSSCAKTVIDFSIMTDAQLILYFENQWLLDPELELELDELELEPELELKLLDRPLELLLLDLRVVLDVVVVHLFSHTE